jgi:hypothetical protein
MIQIVRQLTDATDGVLQAHRFAYLREENRVLLKARSMGQA